MIRLHPHHAFQRFPLAPPGLLNRRTSTLDAFVLCHLGVVHIDASEWSLEIDGLVERPRSFRFEELLRFPKLEVASVHQCCGSPFAPFEPTRRVTNMRWAGARLADVLAECRPAASARYVWCQGADFGEFSGVSVDAYCKDFPAARLSDDVLIAYEMNGEPLLPEHGFPARVVVPGFYGTNSVKWVTRITLSEHRAPGAFTTRWYNDPVLDASGEETGKTNPVWAIAPESVIVAPGPQEPLKHSAEIVIWGWAWADGGVNEVKVMTSDDPRWRAAELEPAHGRQWQRFSLSWTPEHRGPLLLSSRAGTHGGEHQPLAGRRNAIHSVPVMVV